MHLVMALALFIGVYRITKAEWGIQAALWSAFIYAISLPQFLFYWSFFLKMEASIVASLFAMHAYAKKEWRAAIYAALAGIAHPLPIVPLVMAFMITSITNKDARRGFYTSLAGIAGTLIFNGNALKGYSAYVAAYTRGTYAPAAEQFLAGHFVGFSFYHDALMLFYVPFALISLSWCITKNKMPIIGWYALINLAVISVNAAFHNRFIILFDISCIILSGHAFAVFTHKQQKNKVNRILFITAIAFLAVYSLRQSARMEPLVTDAEFNELISMQGNYSTMPLFINSSTYRQFVAGYTNHPVILSSFNDEPWKSLKTASLIYNARRSTPINPKNNSHITQISERFFKYIP